jgi:hypothetical protein
VRKVFLALGLALALFISPAYASTVQIQLSGMNWQYDGSVLYDTGAKNNTGIGSPAESDPLLAAIFLVDGVPVGMQMTNIWFDSYIAVGTLALNGLKEDTVSPAHFGFDLLTQNAIPGWGIALQITQYSVTTDSNNLNATLTGSLLSTSIFVQDLPFGLALLNPVTVSFSATIFNGVPSGDNYASFTAAGTGEITGPEVPAPAAFLLLGPGLLALVSLRRRIKA